MSGGFNSDIFIFAIRKYLCTTKNDQVYIKYYYKPRYTAAVTWTNAEGVTFTIRGAFEKDVLLKMAESVSAD